MDSIEEVAANDLTEEPHWNLVAGANPAPGKPVVDGCGETSRHSQMEMIPSCYPSSEDGRGLITELKPVSLRGELLQVAHKGRAER